jgi:hypothetical protein
VAKVFEDRVRASLPLRADRILHRLKDARGGKVNDPRFGNRMRGEGPHAEAALELFRQTARRLGLAEQRTGEPDSATTFRRPVRAGAQLSLL